jgi:hypothetical protein
MESHDNQLEFLEAPLCYFITRASISFIAIYAVFRKRNVYFWLYEVSLSVFFLVLIHYTYLSIHRVRKISQKYTKLTHCIYSLIFYESAKTS